MRRNQKIALAVSLAVALAGTVLAVTRGRLHDGRPSAQAAGFSKGDLRKETDLRKDSDLAKGGDLGASRP
jgi:hypothetical protein